MNEITIPIYLLTGFLESGKTEFLKFTIGQEYFQIDGTTLLILCEEGEEEYDDALLKRSRTVLEIIESEEDLTYEKLKELNKKYKPERVIVEYNGMWLVSKFLDMKMPRGWGVDQQITCVDATTYQVYVNNMKSQFMDMVRSTDMVIFNRCKREDPLASYRRGIKVVNQSVEIVFEDENGEIDDIFGDEMPFDMNADIIEIMPEDYGIWFVDSMDHPGKYVDKTVRFKGRVARPRGAKGNFFVPGRTAMTCCADDTTFLGYLCVYDKVQTLKNSGWVEVTAKVKVEARPEYRGELGLVLYAVDVKSCEPLEDEMVYFS